ncbi:MAG: hypothetical protein ACT4QG_10160 [Sporichthyaceae bacterium]
MRKLVHTVAVVGTVAAATALALPAVASSDGSTALNLRATSLSGGVVQDAKPGLNAGDRYVEAATLRESGDTVGSLRADCAIAKVFGGKTALGYPKGDYLCTYVAVVRGDQIVFTTGGPYTRDAAFTAAILGGTGKYRTARGEVRIADLTTTAYSLRITLS